MTTRLQKEANKEPKGHPACTLHFPLSGLIKKFIEEDKKDAANNPGAMDTELLFDALGLMGFPASVDSDCGPDRSKAGNRQDAQRLRSLTQKSWNIWSNPCRLSSES